MEGRTWKVRIDVDVKREATGRTFKREETLMVVAETATEAIGQTMAARPGCRVWSVAHQGIAIYPTPQETEE